MTTEVNSQNTTASLKESYLRKVNFEALMKQVNLDLKLQQHGVKPQEEKGLSFIGLLSRNILDMEQHSSQAD